MTASSSTLADLLAEAAAGKSCGFFFHFADETTVVPVEELYARALGRAAQLGGAGLGNGRMVGLLGPNCPQWAEWAWGTWLAGDALVPLPAPLRIRDAATYSAQVASLATATGCSLIVGEQRYLGFLDGDGCPKLDWSTEAPSASSWQADEISPSRLAMVLCTSGSTAAPKAVPMSHARAVVWSRTNATKAPPGVVPASVSWLPFYHIGGLGALFEVVEPVDRHFLPIARFVRDPAEWLRLVSKTRAANTVGPSSAWSAALRGVSKRPAGIDLSCLQGAAFNAEMVDPDVAERITQVGAPLGLAPETLCVHYASSEGGMVSGTLAGKAPRIDAVDLAELARSAKALAPRAGHPVKRVVSCGTPYSGVEVVIGAPSEPLPERHVGEIWVRGAGVVDGYINVANEGRFEQGWFRMGDLGYRAEGELFVTGRSDEVIVRLGEKYYPEDIEQAVQHSTGAPPGSCAAFSPKDGRQGDLVVVVEAGPGPRPTDLASVASAAIVKAIGLTPSEVVVVAKGTIPRTPNGKLQRGKVRQMHNLGELRPIAQSSACGPS
jgi:acyl-CoA synthetase (AMP-forming)/AMP-acid ligase II